MELVTSPAHDFRASGALARRRRRRVTGPRVRSSTGARVAVIAAHGGPGARSLQGRAQRRRAPLSWPQEKASQTFAALFCLPLFTSLCTYSLSPLTDYRYARTPTLTAKLGRPRRSTGACARDCHGAHLGWRTGRVRRGRGTPAVGSTRSAGLGTSCFSGFLILR